MSEVIKHYPHCNANYPEKVIPEAAQGIEIIDLEDGDEVVQCVDCGAYFIRPKQ